MEQKTEDQMCTCGHMYSNHHPVNLCSVNQACTCERCPCTGFEPKEAIYELRKRYDLETPGYQFEYTIMSLEPTVSAVTFGPEGRMVFNYPYQVTTKGIEHIDNILHENVIEILDNAIKQLAYDERMKERNKTLREQMEGRVIRKPGAEPIVKNLTGEDLDKTDLSFKPRLGTNYQLGGNGYEYYYLSDDHAPNVIRYAVMVSTIDGKVMKRATVNFSSIPATNWILHKEVYKYFEACRLMLMDGFSLGKMPEFASASLREIDAIFGQLSRKAYKEIYVDPGEKVMYWGGRDAGKTYKNVLALISSGDIETGALYLMDYMCQQSLAPHDYETWLEVLHGLALSRKKVKEFIEANGYSTNNQQQ